MIHGLVIAYSENKVCNFVCVCVCLCVKAGCITIMSIIATKR